MRENFTAKILNDPSVHYWVKDQYRATLQKDPVDMLNNARLFQALMQERVEAIAFGGR